MIPFPEEKYKIIYSDAPWWYAARNNPNTKFGTGAHKYPLMKTKQIAALPVEDIADRNCALFLWTTGPHIGNAIKVIEAWEFRYVTIAFVWAKVTKDHTGFVLGPGNYTSSNCELVLLGIKGRMKALDLAVPQIIVEPRREHSRKPDVVRDRIVQLFGNLKKIELFARGELPETWEGWGLEYKETK